MNTTKVGFNHYVSSLYINKDQKVMQIHLLLKPLTLINHTFVTHNTPEKRNSIFVMPPQSWGVVSSTMFFTASHSDVRVKK